MVKITRSQFYNLIMSCDAEIHKLPEHVRQNISALRDLTKNGKAHLILTHPKGQDNYFLEYVEVDELSDEEIVETRVHAKENRGAFVAV